VAELNRLLAARRREHGIAADGSRRSDNRIEGRYENRPLVAQLAASIAAHVPDERTKSRQREAWIETIRRRVSDPQLKTCVMVKVASAVVDGYLRPEQVNEIFGELDEHRRKGTLRRASGVYFVAAAKSLFHREHIEWIPKPRRKDTEAC
jgi:hypothetical protein